MKIDVNQVGKKWFIVKGKGIEVEASYGIGVDFVKNESDSREAGYSVYDHVPKRRWNLTGKGAKKYRNEIIKAVTSHLLFGKFEDNEPSESA